MDSKKVFISYSHDSPEHAARVAGLAASLRRDGVECLIDRYVEGNPPDGWPVWMEKSIQWADFVLVVCTETYLRRVMKEEPLGIGRGATLEAHLISALLYDRGVLNNKFIPVLFEATDRAFIPTILRTDTHYLLDRQPVYNDLYARITGQHTPPPPMGPPKEMPGRQAAPLFAEPGREAVAAAKATLGTPRLRIQMDPPYPKDPYPLLHHYKHPELFAGRERDLDELEKVLEEDTPIVGLCSTSGAGKSSFLDAGLTPFLRKKGWPVACTIYPREPELSRRLLEGMFEWNAEKAPGDEPAIFREMVRTAHALSGRPAVLILDQFGDVMDPTAEQARERVERLLTATIEERPFCRWILSYRLEYHGQVEAWLQQAFRKADRTWRNRFRTFPLRPLGATGPTEQSRQAFLAAITAPLKLKNENGEPRYPLRFSEGGVERLAEAFAQARQRQKEAPLLPQLQVVLADLINKSGGSQIEVPENLEQHIGTALAKHLREAIRCVADSHASRAVVLLALRDLATDDGKRAKGRTVEELEGVLDSAILTRLHNEFRILFMESKEGRQRWRLSHDRIAEAVLAEMESPLVKDWLDADVIALRRLIASKSALLDHDPEEATRLSIEHFKNIEKHAGALLRDQTRKVWWKACVQRNNQQIEDLKARLSNDGQADRAMEQLAELCDLGLDDPRKLADLLERRSDLVEVFEEGASMVSERRRNAVLVTAADCCSHFLPARLGTHFDSGVAALGVLLWTLDAGPLRDQDAAVAAKGGEIRRLLVETLRQRNPDIPRLAETDWAFIQGGVFKMGSHLEAFPDERPLHQVEVSSFRLLKHPVTNAEFAALFGDKWADRAARKPRHPAVEMTWYEAYVFAAWLGGRLPTEAEWEYAARSGGKDRQYPWGTTTQGIHRRAVIKHAWRSLFRPGPQPVCRKPQGNTDQGVCDLAGNVWEWVADWYRKYTQETQKDPWGPTSMSTGGRVTRGGAYDVPPERARASIRGGWFPEGRADDLGFRVVVPTEDAIAKYLGATIGT